MRLAKKISVLVGSQNPVKIKAVEAAFAKVFAAALEIKGIKVDSEISSQPMSLEEAFLGSVNRIKNIRKISLADFYVGIEAGLQKYSFGWTAAAVVVVENKKGIRGIGISPQILLPEKMVSEVKNNKELGLVLEKISRVENIKQKQGLFGFLTNNILTRQTAYEPAIIASLAVFLKKKLYAS